MTVRQLLREIQDSRMSAELVICDRGRIQPASTIRATENVVMIIGRSRNPLAESQRKVLTEIANRSPLAEDQRHQAGGFYCQNCSKILCEKQGDICEVCREYLTLNGKSYGL